MLYYHAKVIMPYSSNIGKRMKDKNKEIIKSALFEAVFVVLGVALAFSVNEWRKDKNDKAQVELARITIVKELKANISALEDAKSYHLGLLNTLNAKHDIEWKPALGQFYRGFVAPARISKTAWLSASETEVLSKVDYATVMALSKAYSALEHYEDQTRTVSEIIYTQIFNKGTLSLINNYKNLSGVISTFAYREKELISIMNEIIKEIEK